MQLLSSRVNLQPLTCPPIPSFKNNNSFSANPFLPSSSSSSSSSSHTLSANPHTNSKKKFTLKCRNSEYFDKQKFNKPAEETFTPQALGALPPRVFVGHSIYKGKAALTVEPKSPEFVPLDSGSFKLSKEGFVLLQFAPAVGMRRYDWNRKQVFSLSVTEIGTLMGLGPRDSCEFFHDPFKGKSEEGKVRKVLKAEPLPDGSGHFFNLNVQNKLLNVDENIYIPITKAELTVLISAFNFIMPYLLGWHTFVNSIKPGESSRAINSNTDTNPRSADYEWSR